MTHLLEQRPAALPAPLTETPADPIAVLHVSSSLYDHESLQNIFRKAGWILHTVPTLHSALLGLRGRTLPVIMCERDLPDGDWKVLLENVSALPSPPRLIVACRLADEYLWAEVLNLGGFDVISSPFESREVLHVISHAWGSWQREWHNPERPHSHRRPAIPEVARDNAAVSGSSPLVDPPKYPPCRSAAPLRANRRCSC